MITILLRDKIVCSMSTPNPALSATCPIEALFMSVKLILVAKNGPLWCAGECKSPKISKRSTDPSSRISRHTWRPMCLQRLLSSRTMLRHLLSSFQQLALRRLPWDTRTECLNSLTNRVAWRDQRCPDHDRCQTRVSSFWCECKRTLGRYYCFWDPAG